MRLARQVLLHLANILSAATPPTRFFAMRSGLFRLAGASIDPTAKICGRVVLDNAHVRIGSGTWIGAGCRLIGAKDAPVVIEQNCDLGPEVLIVVGTHDVGAGTRRAGEGRTYGITVGEGSWLGARATVVAGVSIGRGSVIAAGALVNRDCPENGMYAGVPARLVKSLPDLGSTNS